MPAAMKPPKTNTMTSRLTGSAMPSPTRRSISTWWLMSLTSKGTPLVRAVAPGTVARAEEASRWIRSIAASWAALSSPASSVAVTRKPGPVDAACGPHERRGGGGVRAAGDEEGRLHRRDVRCGRHPLLQRPRGIGRGRVPDAGPGDLHEHLGAGPGPRGQQALPGARLPGHARVAGGQSVEEGLAGDAPHRGGEREHHRDQPDAEDPSGAARDDGPQAVHRGRGGGAVPRRASSHAG